MCASPRDESNDRRERVNFMVCEEKFADSRSIVSAVMPVAHPAAISPPTLHPTT